MDKLTDKYNFKKFWDCFIAHNRYAAKWDERRTDQAVFIRRTLKKWFSDKYFAVVFDDYIRSVQIGDICLQEAYRIKYMKYVFIVEIYFAFSKTDGEIKVLYLEPHSLKIEEMKIAYNQWHKIRIEEDRESFTVLRKFYPVEKSEISVPQI